MVRKPRTLSDERKVYYLSLAGGENENDWSVVMQFGGRWAVGMNEITHLTTKFDSN